MIQRCRTYGAQLYIFIVIITKVSHLRRSIVYLYRYHYKGVAPTALIRRNKEFI